MSYPNPQVVLPLPLHPDLGQYRKRAKELVTAARAGDAALVEWATRWVEAIRRASAVEPVPDERYRRHFPEMLAVFARDRLRASGASVAQAQFVIARAHGFESWPRLVHHVEQLTRANSGISSFERAADAIVYGEVATLDGLLRHEPGLVRARSSREHGATLLHYVSANGVENYRQLTPAGIVAIARRLLDAGAEVDAEADMYGGGATTLGLVVTSAHPRAAGVQNELADLLLARGAKLGPRIVRDCLNSGCPEAAAHLAQLGAVVGLVEAAGIGSTDLVRQALAQPGGVSEAEQGDAMEMAGWYRRREVIGVMLELGVDPAIRTGIGRITALHVAASYGALDLVEMLIARGAPAGVADASGYTPVQWALQSWLVDNVEPAGAAFPEVVLALVRAGATVKPEWLDDDRLKANAALYSALQAASTNLPSPGASGPDRLPSHG